MINCYAGYECTGCEECSEELFLSDLTGTTAYLSSGECNSEAPNSSCKADNGYVKSTSIFSFDQSWATLNFVTLVVLIALMTLRFTLDPRTFPSSLIFPTTDELIIIPRADFSPPKTVDSMFSVDFIMSHATGKIGMAGKMQSFLPDHVFINNNPINWVNTADVLMVDLKSHVKRKLAGKSSYLSANLRRANMKIFANESGTTDPGPDNPVGSGMKRGGPGSKPGGAGQKGQGGPGQKKGEGGLGSKPMGGGSKCIQAVDKSKSVPVYWINLKRSASRRKYYTHQMTSMGIANQRIQALTPADSAIRNLTMEVNPQVQNTDVEMSCAISHLLAVHTAVHDEAHIENPYALITEDDVTFEMDVDLRTLAESAPKDFGALQLMTSSSSYVNSFWQKFKNDMTTKMKKDNLTDIQTPYPHRLLWTKRNYDSPYWSTQAYLISKKVARTFIDKVVTYDNSTNSYHIRVINPSEKLFPCHTKKDCFIPFRIVSDTYLFSSLNPTYLSRVPMFNGAAVGQNTTIHKRKNNDVSHAKAFLEIAGTLADVRSKHVLLPPYIRVKNCTEIPAKIAV